MTESLRVLLAVELMGLAALPLAQLALGRLALGGIAFAKPLGLLLVAWLVWMGTVLGLRNDLALTAGAAGLLALAGLAALVLARPRIEWRRLLAFEALFAAAFAACALFNAYSPDVWQTEKPMDMALVNATIVSDGHPPHDPWMAGEDLNYYYLGQFALGVLIRLTDIEPSAGYNLALAVLLGLAVVSAAGLAAAIAREAGARAWVAGSAAVVLLVVAGTPGGGLDALGHGGDWREFGWFGASRVIPGTINEFPFFSFLLGDLHAHVIAGPLTLVALAFCVQVALHGPPRRLGFWERLLTGLVIGTLYAVNSWSFPVCAGLLVVALVAHARAEGRRAAATAHGVVVLGLAIAAVAPFLLEFEPNARGVGLVGSRRREGLGDFLSHHGALYGTLAWVLAALYLGRARAAEHPLRMLVFSVTAGIVALPLLAEIDLAGAGAFALLLLVALLALWSRRAPVAERAVWLLVAGGLTCLLLPELVYVRDEFDGSDLSRMNTVFKMGYQAWYLLAVAAGCAVAMSGRWLPRLPRAGWALGALALVAVGLAFSVVGSYARKAGFTKRPTLDGRTWLPPEDVAAIDWIRANTDGDAVIAEAVGDDYSAFGHARISTFTGRPAVIGWEGHEVQWNHDPGTRREDVQRLYTSRNPREVTELLAKLRIEYAVLGQLERVDYGDSRALAVLGRKVFERGGTAIYAYTPPPQEREEPEPPEPGGAAPPILGGG